MTLFIIVGATATGKSELALDIAERIDGEIINADSMQLYRGMDIGTAKLSPGERRGITHHLIDTLNVNEESSVAAYQESARSIIDRLISEGKSVVVVGGTGLYIKAILDDLNFPETNPEVRKRISDEAERLGAEIMHQRLSKLDPAAAVAITKENVRRVVRALEVIEITGRPFTAHLPRASESRYPSARQIGLVMNRENLRERIDRRVDHMWERGLVDEVKPLFHKAFARARPRKPRSVIRRFSPFLMARSQKVRRKKRRSAQPANMRVDKRHGFRVMNVFNG